MFGGALIAELRRRLGDRFGLAQSADPNDIHPDCCILLATQYRLGRFRYDLAMQIKGDEKPFLLIECDGKLYHSSPEQIANDRLKDACAAQNRIRLLRFSGADIHYRIDKCIAETICHIPGAK